nr:hypothetical protein [uncultured Faecalibacillus sp.]
MANAKFFYSVSVVESEFVFSFDEESSVVFCDESLSSLFVVLSLDVLSSFLDEEDSSCWVSFFVDVDSSVFVLFC